MGVKIYRALSDINFRRETFVLLGVSGVGLLVKAVDTFPAVTRAIHAMGRWRSRPKRGSVRPA